ncbi:MAG: methyltransferase domain-containing protein [Bryobacteraceae bacterium]|jgi:tRNA (mo5U34)-methyltransferase
MPVTEEFTKELNSLYWWHTIDLGDGIVTPGRDQTPVRIKLAGIPDDLTGKSVLDIGAWDGAFSFECERRGARRVLAVDEFIWVGKAPWTAGKAGFDFARRALKSNVEDMVCDVYDLSPERVGTFDLVVFSGVLYHLKHPLLALERVASVCGDMLICGSNIDMVREKRPAIAFYPGEELEGDPSNWCGPNVPALEAMLRTVGFSKVILHRQSPPPRRWSRRASGTAWAVMHAWK